jgi:hypothetical protein
MSLNYKKQLLVAIWIVGILLTATLASVQSQMAWLVVSVVAFGPAAALLHFSREVPQTISERIQRARR